MVTCPRELSLQLRAEAEVLLRERGLTELLGRYGRLVPHGSFALDLMVWRDLDLYLCAEAEALTITRFFELGAQLTSLLDVQRLHFRDERETRSPGLPAGLYWGVHSADEPPGPWKIDIWAVDPGELRRLMSYQERVESALTPESRRIILDIKTALHNHPDYRRGFGAKDIYDAVLESGVRDLPGFCSRLGLAADPTR
jgi:hypothetical protein